MKTYWDETLQKNILILQPNEFYVTDKSEIISTTLGSCIAVCIRDKKNNVAGMNHYLLPDDGNKNSEKKSLKYGRYSLMTLIEHLIMKGGDKKFLEAKIFGGSSLFNSNFPIGQENILCARNYLKAVGIPIIREDIGGPLARKIFFNTNNGEVLRTLVSSELIKEYIENHSRN